MKKCAYWNSVFALVVVNSYEKGTLTFKNMREWETKYNGGFYSATLGTREILEHYISLSDAGREKKRNSVAEFLANNENFREHFDKN